MYYRHGQAMNREAFITQEQKLSKEASKEAIQELREKIASEVYEFVHRGDFHMTWTSLPYKWGKKSYLDFTEKILTLVKEADN